MAGFPLSPNTTWPPPGLASGWKRARFNSELRRGTPGVHVEAQRRGFDTRLWVPVPKKMAEVQADLLFGERPSVKAGADADADASATLITNNRLISRLHGLAMATGSEGQVWGKAYADPSTPRGRRSALIEFLPDWRVIPEFRNFDELVAAHIVTQWDAPARLRVNRTSDNRYRLFESHYPGRVEYRLFSGSVSSLGSQIALQRYGATEALIATTQEVAGDPFTRFIETGVDELLVVQMVNAVEGVEDPRGVSDYDGMEDLFYAISEAATRGQDAMRSAIQRLLVDKRLLDERNNLSGLPVIAVDGMGGEMEDGQLLKEFTPKFAATDFTAYQTHLLDLTLELMGISPQSFGRNVDGGAVSGTALKLKQTRTMLRSMGKATYLTDAVGELLRLAQLLDASALGHTWSEPGTAPKLEVTDPIPEDPREVADEVTAYLAAGILSKRAAIKRVHPHWSEQQIDAELAELKGEADEGNAQTFKFLSDSLHNTSPLTDTAAQ